MATIAAVTVVALGVTACGGGSSSTSTASSSAAQQQNGGRRGFLSDPKVQACLKKQGVTLAAGRRNGGPPNGQPPNGQPPTGTNRRPPTGTNGNRPNSARFQKLRAALQKCGVTLPNRGQNGQPPQAAPSGTTAS
jgi:hypothetical protein